MTRRIVIVGGPALLLASLALCFLVRPAYRSWKQSRALAQARQFLTKDDLRNASLSARRVLAINDRNLEGSQILAHIAEAVGAPQALDWRRRVVELAPTTENKLQLIATALCVEPAPCRLAARTLEEIAPSAQNSARFHVLAAELALKLNKWSEATGHFIEASRLDPTNELHRLDAAILQLRSTNSAAIAEAHAVLERLTTNSWVAAKALRSLVSYHLAAGNLQDAREYSGRLLEQAQARFEDRLQLLEILDAAKSPEAGPVLASAQAVAVTNGAAMQAVCAWMIRHGQAEQAFAWVTNCSAGILNELEGRPALVNCYAARKDWAGLERFLGTRRWEELECVRLAWLSRCAWERKEEVTAEARWRLAVREAGGRLTRLASLYDLAASFGREKQCEDLLWNIGENFRDQRWALQELARKYNASGNTRSLYKAYSLMVSRNGGDAVAQNNFVATSLLLNQNLPQSHQLASNLYSRWPDDAIITSTYAFSLHLQGRTKEGIALLEKLQPAALTNSGAGLYYGLLLSADGQVDRAAYYLADRRLGKLLPEERTLVNAALKH